MRTYARRPWLPLFEGQAAANGRGRPAPTHQSASEVVRAWSTTPASRAIRAHRAFVSATDPHGHSRGRFINLEAIDDLGRRFPDLDVILVESCGDNLAATFSPELADLTLYVVDVAGGDKIPRKGGPGITKSDLLIINKTHLAPHVGASLEVMDRDARRMRGDKPFVFTSIRQGEGLAPVVEFVVRNGLLRAPSA